MIASLYARKLGCSLVSGRYLHTGSLGHSSHRLQQNRGGNVLCERHIKLTKEWKGGDICERVHIVCTDLSECMRVKCGFGVNVVGIKNVSLTGLTTHSMTRMLFQPTKLLFSAVF